MGGGHGAVGLGIFMLIVTVTSVPTLGRLLGASPTAALTSLLLLVLVVVVLGRLIMRRGGGGVGEPLGCLTGLAFWAGSVLAAYVAEWLGADAMQADFWRLSAVPALVLTPAAVLILLGLLGLVSGWRSGTEASHEVPATHKEERRSRDGAQPSFDSLASTLPIARQDGPLPLEEACAEARRRGYAEGSDFVHVALEELGRALGEHSTGEAKVVRLGPTRLDPSLELLVATQPFWQYLHLNLLLLQSGKYPFVLLPRRAYISEDQSRKTEVSSDDCVGYLWPRRDAIDPEAYQQWLEVVLHSLSGSKRPADPVPPGIIRAELGGEFARWICGEHGGHGFRIDAVAMLMARLDLFARFRGSGSDDCRLAHVILGSEGLRSRRDRLAWTEEGEQRLEEALARETVSPWFEESWTEGKRLLRRVMAAYTYRSWRFDGSTEMRAEIARLTLLTSGSRWRISREVIWQDTLPGDYWS